jgi:hypothetical protein
MEVTIAKGRATFNKEASKWGYVKGEAKWCKFLKPDDYDKFSVNLSGSDIEDLIVELEAMRDEAVEAVEALGKKAIPADVYKEEEDGTKFISFKLPAVDYEGKPNKIKVYDVSGNLVEDWDKEVGNGSVIKIKYQAKPYYMASTKMVGISYRFYAMQIIKLEEYTSKDSGFGDETDGNAPFDTDEDF